MEDSINEVVEILKSGDFTIIYWDNATPSLYKGKWEANEKYDGYYDEMGKAEILLDDFFDNGYCPAIVYLLTVALNGSADSI